MPRAETLKKSTPSPTKTQPSSPGSRKLKQQWKASMLASKWALQPGFRHPRGTETFCKGTAMKKFKLTSIEVETLPYEIMPHPDMAYPMHMYSYDQLMELAKRKSATLSTPLKVGGLAIHYHSGSSQTGSVSVVSLKNPPKLPAWAEHIGNPQPPPLKMADYTSPPDAATPDPETIIWTLSRISGPVTVEDACRLYGITPDDIRDLSDHSPWIDLETVAKRAVSLHGGFYAHEKLLRRFREEEEARLDKTYKGYSDFKFSPAVLDQIEQQANDSYYYKELLYGSPCASQKENRVAVLYPIYYTDPYDNGCGGEWEPYWGEF